MFLQALIIENLANRDINEVARQLGYKTPEKVSARIKAITDSPCLALDKSSFDFRYSTPELIRKLCEILGIPDYLCNKIISETEAPIYCNSNKNLNLISILKQTFSVKVSQYLHWQQWKVHDIFRLNPPYITYL